MNQFVKIAVMIGAMILSRFVDTSNPAILLKVRIGYVITIILTAGLNYYIRTIVRRKHDDTRIYIVNKMLGQETVEETTYFEKEETMCTQAITGSVSGVLMTLGLMSYKMGMHYGMVMSILQLPLNLYNNLLFQKHVLNKELDHPWKEQTDMPLSKMNVESSEKAMRDEITKCWDDGEMAKYDHLMEYLAKAGVNVQNDRGWTALMVVMGNPLGDCKTVAKLLKMGADPKMVDEDGWTCLHWAAHHSNVGAVEVMMECGATRTVIDLLVVKDKKGMNPMEVATKEGQTDFEVWLRTTIIDEIEVMKDMGDRLSDDTERQLIPLLKDKQ